MMTPEEQERWKRQFAVACELKRKHEQEEGITAPKRPRKGRKLTQAHKDAISRASKGKVGPNRGKTLSAETRAKMSEAHRGQVFTPEHRARISQALKTSPVAAASRAKVSASLVGGHHSPETIAKMKVSQYRHHAKRRAERAVALAVQLANEHKKKG